MTNLISSSYWVKKWNKTSWSISKIYKKEMHSIQACFEMLIVWNFNVISIQNKQHQAAHIVIGVSSVYSWLGHAHSTERFALAPKGPKSSNTAVHNEKKYVSVTPAARPLVQNKKSGCPPSSLWVNTAIIHQWRPATAFLISGKPIRRCADRLHMNTLTCTLSSTAAHN